MIRTVHNLMPRGCADLVDLYRTYRQNTPGLNCFRISIGETDLWVESSWDCRQAIEVEVKKLRIQLRSYIDQYPLFAQTLSPWRHPEPENPPPPLIQTMILAAENVGVGPMAAVAGAISGVLGYKLYRPQETLIIENGGDIFLSSPLERRVGIYAGRSNRFSRIALRITPEALPLGICTSAGRIGPSLSFGEADAVTVLSKEAAAADAAATAIANRIRNADDLEGALEWSRKIPELLGVLAIYNETLAAWGMIEIVSGHDTP